MGAGAAGVAARRALESMVTKLPGGERRDGQLDMCEAVAGALETSTHLVVEAGTGVGKSLAYLVAAVLSGRRVVVATARKPLQDQLIDKDIPFVASALPNPVDAAVLKGRSNYLCLAKLAEANGVDGQARLDVDARAGAFAKLTEWALTATSGDLAGAPVLLGRALRGQVTVSPQECPGARECPHGDDCFAERALELAREAQLVVTNIDLYCLDVAIGGGLLGEHDAVIIDEAHELESIAGRVFGLELGRRRLSWLAAQLRGVLVPGAAEPRRVDQAGDALAGALESFGGQRVDVEDRSISDALAVADGAVTQAMEVLRRVPESGAVERDGRVPRCMQAASTLLEDVRAARVARPGYVAWVDEGDDPVLHVAPIEVGPSLASLIYSQRTTVLTSATLSVGGSLDPLASRLGLDAGVRKLRVASPFDYRAQARLYCAAHLPDPRRAPAEFDAAALDELAGLVDAAGGRTLALFTTHRMLRLAAETLEARFAWPVFVQDGPPEPGLIERFRDDEHACLLATMGYWQGVDVPGPSLSLVVIDRLPFPPLRDPLLSARRDAARAEGKTPFDVVDLPVAATLLAQGAGRLIRATSDRGVVAVLDRRLARAPYRRSILDSLPPMRRVVDGAEVRRVLAELAAARPGQASSTF